MIQFLADQLDQLDLALDYLAIKDRNFDRVALMLIDNAVELVLHQYAKYRRHHSDMYRRSTSAQTDDSKLITEALGHAFDKKVKLAKKGGLLSEDIASSVKIFHAYRNTAYHAGDRHEEIIRSLALLYLRTACDLLIAFKPGFVVSSSRDKIPYRARKYLGPEDKGRLFLNLEAFQQAWKTIQTIAESFGDTLIEDLRASWAQTIDETDGHLSFLADDQNPPTTRTEVVRQSQAWRLAWSQEGRDFAAHNDYQWPHLHDLINWLERNYPLNPAVDPIPQWTSRMRTLSKDESVHKALKKYYDFMTQTADIRELLLDAAQSLDQEIQSQIDAARGK